jgi:hypothetical protein
VNPVVFPPAAPSIFVHYLNQPGLNRILVYIPQKQHEVVFIVYRLAPESVLKHGPQMLIFFVIVPGIAHTDTLDRSQRVIFLPDQKMDVIGHQAIGIDGTLRRQIFVVVVDRVDLSSEQIQKAFIVIDIVENVLTIDTSEHHVIDARSAVFS